MTEKPIKDMTFLEFLKWNSEAIAAWPEWKRNAFRPKESAVVPAYPKMDFQVGDLVRLEGAAWGDDFEPVVRITERLADNHYKAGPFEIHTNGADYSAALVRSVSVAVDPTFDFVTGDLVILTGKDWSIEDRGRLVTVTDVTDAGSVFEMDGMVNVIFKDDRWDQSATAAEHNFPERPPHLVEQGAYFLPPSDVMFKMLQERSKELLAQGDKEGEE